MAYPEPFQLKVRRFLLKRSFRLIFRFMFKVEISGWEHVPRSGAYVIAHNHVSIIEPALILSFWPANAEAIGAAELWTRRGQSGIIRMYGTLPVHRGTPEKELIRTMVGVLKAGSPLLIAPEGTRSHVPGMGQAAPGIGYMIDQAGVPVLPIGVIGSTDANLSSALRLKRPKLTMRIGRPFKAPEIEGSGAARREARKANTEMVMLKICALLPEEYWGVYGEKYRQSGMAAQ